MTPPVTAARRHSSVPSTKGAVATDGTFCTAVTLIGADLEPKTGTFAQAANDNSLDGQQAA